MSNQEYVAFCNMLQDVADELETGWEDVQAYPEPEEDFINQEFSGMWEGRD